MFYLAETSYYCAKESNYQIEAPHYKFAKAGQFLVNMGLYCKDVEIKIAKALDYGCKWIGVCPQVPKWVFRLQKYWVLSCKGVGALQRHWSFMKELGFTKASTIWVVKVSKFAKESNYYLQRHWFASGTCNVLQNSNKTS